MFVLRDRYLMQKNFFGINDIIFIVMANLQVNIAGLKMKNPVMTASGTYGYGIEYADFLDISYLGAVIIKGTTLEPRQGNPYPRMAETPSGMLNAVGLQNPGVDAVINNIYPLISKIDTNFIVNVSGACIDDYVAVCERLSVLDDLEAVEINISCPNVKQGGMSFGTTVDGATMVTRAVRKAWHKTLIVKLTPNVTDITQIAKAVEAEGADAVSLINTMLGMAIDVKRRRPFLSTVTGGLSGPAIRPVALRMVWQTAKSVKIPVIGIGGITDADSALQFLMAGASAIQVGTANFIDPSVTVKIIDGINAYCEQNDITDIRQLVGIV